MNTKFLISIYLCAASVSLSFSVASAAPTVDQQLIVKFKSGVSDAEKSDFLKRHGLSQQRALKGKSGVGVFNVPAGLSSEAVLNTLKQEGILEYAEPKHEMIIFSSANSASAFATQYGNPQIQLSESGGRIVVDKPVAQNSDPKTTAEQALEAAASLMNIDASAQVFSSIRESATGHHVRFHTLYQGTPVYGQESSVHINRSGGVSLIQSSSHLPENLNLQATMTDASAKSKAFSEVGISNPASSSVEQVYFQDAQKTWHLAWRVRARNMDAPSGDWDVLIDSQDGSVLQVHNRMARFTGNGDVFDANPVQRANKLGVTAPTHGSDICPEAAPIDASDLTLFVENRNLDYLDRSGYLQGDNIKVVNTKYDGIPESSAPDYAALTSVAKQKKRIFNYAYNDASGRFEEVMSYFHTYNMHQRIIAGMGYSETGLLSNIKITVDAHHVNSDGSNFIGAATFAPDLVLIGDQHSLDTSRCREMGEEGDAIAHEFVHVMYADIQPDRFYDNASLEEGWADYLMASTFDDPIVGEWSDEIGGTGFRRTLDNTYTMGDWQNECGFGPNAAAAHFNGQIWGGALWKIREALMNQFVIGSTTRADVADLMDRLVIEGMYLFDAPIYGQNCTGEENYRARDAILHALTLLKNMDPADARYDARYAEISADTLIDIFSDAGIGQQLPNDPYFDSSWTLHNTGSAISRDFNGNVNGVTAIPAGNDIDAPEAWTVQTGRSDVVVAIADSGVSFKHRDLGYEDGNFNGILDTGEDLNGNGVLDTGNLWVNSNEIAGNGVDDDGNGYIDDMIGWWFGDCIDNCNDPTDPALFFGWSHGTRVAGVVGAIGNNGLGVSGINWQSGLMAQRLSPTDTSTATEALDYAANMGAMVMNGSWGIWPWYSWSRTLHDGVARAEQDNLLFVMAAGNTGQSDGNGTPLNADNDVLPIYPQSEPLPNMLNVTALDAYNNQRERFGKFSVDLGAPTGAYATNNHSGGTDSYFALGQTSGASPHVTGVVALLLAEEKDRIDANPGYRFMTVGEIRYLVLTSVDPLDSLKDKCVSEGRLNAHKLLLNYSDTDMDGYTDRVERLFGTAVEDALSYPDMLADNDGDGLNNGLELGYGTIPVSVTAGADMRGLIYPIYLDDVSGALLAGYSAIDTDGDGINDADEASVANGFITDPANPDSDGDGIQDGSDTSPTLVLAPPLSLAVSTVSPEAGAENQSINTVVQISFNQDMDPGSINANTISMFWGFGFGVSAQVTCDTPCRTATLTPDVPLQEGQYHFVNVASGPLGVLSASGEELSVGFSSTFTTGTTSVAACMGTGSWSISGASQESKQVQITGADVTLSGPGGCSDNLLTDNRGKYKFTSVADGDYIVTPNKVGCTFTPTSLPVSVSGGNATKLDFTGVCQ